MIELTEPQVWVLIGLLAASTFGMIAIISVSFTRTLTAAIGGVRSELAGLESGLRGEISGFRDAMDAQFQAMDAKFSDRFDALDRDIQSLSRREFGAE